MDLPLRAVIEPAHGAEMATKLITCFCSHSLGCCVMKYSDTRQPKECATIVACRPSLLSTACSISSVKFL